MRLTSFVLAGLLTATGCLDGLGGGDARDAGPREGSPAGPYGVTEGDVIADLAFLDPSGASFTLSHIYQDGANTLLLVSTAAFWCVACIEEQPDLQTLHETHGPDGLFVLAAVFEDAQYQPAEAADAARWQTDHGVDFQVVADPGFSFAAYYDSSLTPMNMLVEVEAMEVLRINTGWDPVLIRSLIEAKL